MKHGPRDARRIWLESPAHLGRVRLLVPEHDATAVREACDAVGSADELLAHLEMRVSPPTLQAIADRLVEASDLRAPLPALAAAARRGEARVLLTFAGQAQSYLEDLQQLFDAGGASRAVIEACAEALTDELAQGAGLAGHHSLGLDLLTWLTAPETRPSAEALAAGPLSQPLIFVAQAARLATLGRYGLDPEAIGEWCIAATGHSQGIVAAMLAAEGHRVEALPRRAAAFARALLWQGVHMQNAYGRSGRGEAPMVAVSGLLREELEAALPASVAIALVNAPRRFVLSGPPPSLKRAVDRLERAARKAQQEHAAGRRELPRVPSIEWLGVSAPFHSTAMQPAVEPVRAALARLEIAPHRFAVPVLDNATGELWTAEHDLATNQSLLAVDWPRTLAAARRLDVTHVVDLGPGEGVAALAGLCTRGFGVRVIGAAGAEGRATLAAREPAEVAAPAPWTEYAPVRVEVEGQAPRLENAFTRATGRPPILLPGMTPTTVEVPIVAAAANAGFLAELAGGGQPTEAILRRRCEALRAALEPGEGYVFNTLYLDPHLWGLHVGRDRLVQRLRAEGHPILGVTISAGLPPRDEAVALLREWRAAGMHLNALKVGSDDQMKAALAIAAAADDGPLFLHVEGGRAGGHHNFSGLDELLLRWYARVRRHPNVVLCVGGGIDGPAKAEAYLTGAWSAPHNIAPMPVDAVFIGTAAMATAEACTSPAVKRALVEASGVDAQIPRGEARGGVLSTRSGLGADIHYLANHAGRTAAMLDEIAGDAEAVAARKDEIVEALNRTAKPYFGDVDGMSYRALLERLHELMAIGGDADESVWLDPSHRARFAALLERALRRCGFEGAIPAEETLDADALAHVDCPALATTPVLPEDARFFVEVCGWPGKPVPFVPVIDANVHRWYSRDALWQSHDARYAADAVLVIPGPAVSGIETADEPVAALLDRFIGTTRDAARAENRPAADPVVLALETPECWLGGRARPNPLPALVEAGATLEVASGDDALRRGGARREPQTAGARRPVRAGEHCLRLTIEHPTPAADPRTLTLDFDLRPDHPAPLRARPDHAERLRAFYRDLMPTTLDLDAARIATYRRVVGDDGPEAPIHLAFAAAMPAMMQALLGEAVGGDPLSLLHHTSEIELLRPLTAGACRVEVDAPHVEDGPSGRAVAVAARLLQGDAHVARLVQRFLIRETDRAADASGTAPSALTPESAPLERPRPVLDAELRAPVDLAAFALASGDLNPIHRDPALAALAGLPGPIVHGQWTAAAACGLLAERGLRHAAVRFLAPVMPGASLRVEARVVGRVEGDEVIEAEVRDANGPVLSLRARRRGPRAAIVCPGQGCQRRGMGMDAFARSTAARAVWERADAHTRATHGFSLLEVVRTNPVELDVAGELLRHPQGVLNVTQITQVALTVLTVAGVAELNDRGALPADALFGGHSVGEYAALSAMTGVLPLESLIDVVYQRGRTMQHFVPRDAEGRSPYGMGVIRPHKVDLDGAGAQALVERVAAESGRPLYVVNHNVRDRQYAVAGHVEAIAALKAELSNPDGWVDLAGIDVPFHSPLLVDGVAEFRAVLEACFPADLDVSALEGRYLPNLVARPFAVTPNFVAAVVEATKVDLPADIGGRALLIEVLAWQFASPVRWIETQALLAEQVERVVEVGPGAAPVLVNMLRSSLRGGDVELELLHAERDREVVLGEGPEPVQVEPEPVAQTVAPVTAAGAPAPAVETLCYGPAEALFAVLTRSTGQAEIARAQTLDDLLGGNSAKRNQVLLDIGKELGVGPVDGAHTMPLHDLADALTREVGARYRHPGPFLRAAQDEALAELGTTRKAAEALLTGRGADKDTAAALLTRVAIEGLTVEAVAPPPPANAPVQHAVAPLHAAPAAMKPLRYGPAEALFAVLRRATGQADFAKSETLDDVLGGNSARRNQVLLDIGKELGAGPVDGAHTMPLRELADALTREVGARYRHPGPYLRAAQDEALAELGTTRKAAEGLLTGRGADKDTAAALLTRVAIEGLTVEAVAPAPPANAPAQHAAVAVDPEAERSRWRPLARAALQAAGIDPSLLERPAPEAPPAPVAEPPVAFRPERHVAFTAAAAWARADALWAFGELLAGRETTLDRVVAGRTPALDQTLIHLRDRAEAMGRADVAAAFADALETPPPAQPWRDDTALVTGAGPGSIAEAIVERLLAGGARVVVTTSRMSRARVARYKALYRAHATPGAELHVVPFDQGKREEVDALCRWIHRSHHEVRGPKRVRVKDPWVPTLCFPFAAMPAEGDPSELGDDIEATLAVNLVGVERLVGGLAREAATNATAPVHVVLPLSPNHGQMGRDGLYAEAKAGLEALLLRWRAEHDRWGRHATLVGARIGWVRGTGLMAALDRVYEQVETELGIRTFATGEMADLLLERCDADARAAASEAPQIADLTGGFGEATGLRPLIERALAAADTSTEAAPATAAPLPCPRFEFPALPESSPDAAPIDPASAVAVVGFAEVGPFGNERIRWAMERDGALSAEAALELAWLCGCVRFERGAWVDVESGEAVDPVEVFDRYRLAERVGVRPMEAFDPSRVEVFTEVVLEQDLAFTVPDEAKARSFAALDPEHTEVFADGEGGWRVLRRAGAKIRVPRATDLRRDVAGQLPEGWDPTRLGVDPGWIDPLDPTAVFNLVATAEAFRSAGLAPEELWREVHPARVGCTQGSGIGGMRALNRLYVDPVLDKTRQTDVLQETLINVSAAWPAMAFYGSYGPMVHPVGACATAALSLEIGADLIRAGKADLVVAGAYDDLGEAGMRGFGDMQATVDADTLAMRGFEPDQASRPCDTRRAGFVEAQGGGTLLLCRADLALELGLPIYGLVAGAWSAGDGLQRSVPAPGPGLLRIGAGGADSPLGQALAALNLSADDIGVVSMHGTSTEANDLNETRLHVELAAALGRTPGNPLPVVAQKALTGHAKGGAAAWQACGLLQALNDRVVPPMRNLDEPDPVIAERAPLVFPDRPTHAPMRAGLLTSLGFGHVGAATLFAHADVLLETLDAEQRAAYAEKREARWRARFAEQHAVLLGETPLFSARLDKPLDDDGERALLLDPAGRLGPDGHLESGRRDGSDGGRVEPEERSGPNRRSEPEGRGAC